MRTKELSNTLRRFLCGFLHWDNRAGLITVGQQVLLCLVAFLLFAVLGLAGCENKVYAQDLTEEQIKDFYHNLQCKVTEFNEQGRPTCIKCYNLDEFIIHWKEQWDCMPQWCDLPVQDCSLPPLTGGKDSCGNTCSKPSLLWPNCKCQDGTVKPKTECTAQ